MKKLIMGHVPTIIVILMYVIFNVIFWPIVGPMINDTKTTLWISFGFLTLAFLILGVTTSIKLKNKNNLISLVPVLYDSVIYLFLSLVLNITFMIVNTDNRGGFIADLVVNVIFLLIFVIFLLMALKHLDRVSSNTAAREERMETHTFNIQQYSMLIYKAHDPEVKKALEHFRYELTNSSSSKNDTSSPFDAQLESQYNIILDLLTNDGDKVTTLDAIRDAELLLKQRNQALARRR